MSTIKISQLPSITGANTAGTDLLPIVDTSLNVTNKITREEFFTNVPPLSVSGNITVTGTVDGRDILADGTKLDGIEAGAEVNPTASEIKTLYESNLDTNAYTDAEKSKLAGIEAGADVTDTANVTAAGALMDSELTNIAAVKALDQGVSTTDSPTFAGLTATSADINGGTIDGTVIGGSTPAAISGTTGTFSGDVALSGTGRRIIGDMSNATHANRLSFQTSVTDGATSPFFLPNGTANVASVVVANASDPTNSSFGQLVVNGTSDVRVVSGYLGTGTALPMTFHTNGTERLRITSTGNVSIGTSSPAGKLHVRDDVVTGKYVFQSTDQRLTLGTYWESGVGQYAFINSSTDNENTAQPLLFMTGNTERARIGASGNLLVGTTSGTSARVTASAGTLEGMRVINDSGATRYPMAFQNGASTVGSIQTSTTTTSYNTASDYRLKEDVQPMTGASDRVLALNPVNFAWKASGERVDGFLAHEAQEVVPEAVTGEKDAVDKDGKPQYQGIDQSKLVPLLTAALQEALTKIEALEARITALEA